MLCKFAKKEIQLLDDYQLITTKEFKNWTKISTEVGNVNNYPVMLSMLSQSYGKQMLLTDVQQWHGKMKTCITEKENTKYKKLAFWYW